jgi:hypothetical protein
MNIRPGSVIEYETELQQHIGHCPDRMLAFVVRIEYASRYSRTRFYAVTLHDGMIVIDLHAVTCIVAI